MLRKFKLVSSLLINPDQELSQKSLRHFAQIAFAQIEPAREFLSNWHIDAIRAVPN